MFKISANNAIPIYRQIVHQVERMIAADSLKTGDELPSVRSLAEQHAVNPMTISKAYSMLEASGHLQRQRGKGMRVAAGDGNNKQTVKQRLAQLDEPIEQLANAAVDLGLTTEQVSRALIAHMEKIQ